MRKLLSAISKRFFLVATTLCLLIAMNSAFAGDSLVNIVSGNMGWVFGLGFMVLEFILGKTDKVKSGSTLELVLRTIMGILEKLTDAKKSSLVQGKKL